MCFLQRRCKSGAAHTNKEELSDVTWTQIFFFNFVLVPHTR
jgi:hypothetical protein